jgi:hypothetical protein
MLYFEQSIISNLNNSNRRGRKMWHRDLVALCKVGNMYNFQYRGRLALRHEDQDMCMVMVSGRRRNKERMQNCWSISQDNGIIKADLQIHIPGVGLELEMKQWILAFLMATVMGLLARIRVNQPPPIRSTMIWLLELCLGTNRTIKVVDKV